MKTFIMIFSFVCATWASADVINIAVASNFAKTMGKVGELFQAKTGHKVLLSPGATGKLYAQIKNGAPFDAFFSADSERPEILVKEGLAHPDSECIYAHGKVALYSQALALEPDPRAVLLSGQFKNLALANPDTAPYGAAAVEVMKAWGVYEGLKPKLVYGESVAQAFHYVSTGNAQIGFVSVSQLMEAERPIRKGQFYILPQSLYKPILQKAVILKRTKLLQVVKEFLASFRTEPIRQLMGSLGYDAPLG